MNKAAILAAAGILATSVTGQVLSDDTKQEDPLIWMEEVLGEKPLAWVREQNDRTLTRLEKDPRFERIQARGLDVLNASDRIPYAGIIRDEVFNFWQDADHVRGILRKMKLDDYIAGGDTWETVLDIDALAESEGENWVYKGRNCLPPEYDRCLVQLSRGGGDAVVVREFDLTSNMLNLS